MPCSPKSVFAVVLYLGITGALKDVPRMMKVTASRYAISNRWPSNPKALFSENIYYQLWIECSTGGLVPQKSRGRSNQAHRNYASVSIGQLLKDRNTPLKAPLDDAADS